MQKAGYLGPYGSYSRLAAQNLCKDCTLVPYQNFPLLMRALLLGEVDCIVMPIENTLNGGVTQNIDILQATEGVVAKAEYFVHIDHRLVTLPNADISKIKTVYSHAQALGQCAKYLAENLPFAKQMETSSTAGSLEMIKTCEDAGIVGSHCDAQGFCVSPECISDEKKNFTQFLLVTKGTIADDMSSSKIYFSVTCPHESGALMKLLSVLYAHKLNMTKIGSRPIKDRLGEYRFFIEMEADYAKAEVKTAIADIKAYANSFKLLGCY